LVVTAMVGEGLTRAKRVGEKGRPSLITAEGEGIEAPVEGPALPAAAVEALAELSRLQAHVVGLAREIAAVEKRMRQILRQGV
jgi:hypothetical protein